MEKKKVKFRNKKALVLNIFSGCFGFVILLMILSFIFRIVAPRQLQSKATGSVELVPVYQPLQISIINACGTDGIAKKVKSCLNSNKYNVVGIGNLPAPADKSYIKCISSDSKILDLAAGLGIDGSMIKTTDDNNSNQVITVVIGKDYLQLKPFKVK